MLIGGQLRVQPVQCLRINRQEKPHIGLNQILGHDAMFGPAADGGYWLVGLRRRAVPRYLFEGVHWSGPQALTDTIATLGPRARVAMLETLHDIDTADDLARWRGERP